MMNLAFGLIFNIVQKIPQELSIFFSEYASSILHLSSSLLIDLYRVDTYYLAKTLVDLPFEIFFPSLFCIIVYYLVGFQSSFARCIAFIGILILVTNASTFPPFLSPLS